MIEEGNVKDNRKGLFWFLLRNEVTHQKSVGIPNYTLLKFQMCWETVQAPPALGAMVGWVSLLVVW